jgi:hypothetical protein
MFFYTIINIFITCFENVNESRTSAGSLSLTLTSFTVPGVHVMHVFHLCFFYTIACITSKQDAFNVFAHGVL